MSIKPFNLNNLSDLGRLQVEQLKTDVKIYAAAKNLPVELRFANATYEHQPGGQTVKISVDCQIFNTNTNTVVQSWTVTSITNDLDVSSDILIKIHQGLQSKI